MPTLGNVVDESPLRDLSDTVSWQSDKPLLPVVLLAISHGGGNLLVARSEVKHFT